MGRPLQDGGPVLRDPCGTMSFSKERKRHAGNRRFLTRTALEGRYKARRDELMERLVVLQQQARVQGVGLVVLFEGWNGAGKGSRISDLMYHLARAPPACTSLKTST